MFHLSTFLWSAIVVATVSADPVLERRAACSCPSTDVDFYPLASNSGAVGGTLNCVYPDLSRCQYAVSNGALTKDTDAGLCPSLANGQNCPTADLGGYALGPGSGVHQGVLFCTYPTTSELSSTIFSCQYSSTTGALAADNDVGFCPVNAQCSGAVPPPVTTSIAVSGATTLIPTVTTQRGITTTPGFATTVGPGGSFTTSGNPSFASVSSSNSGSNNRSTTTPTKHITAIAVGAALGGIVLLSGGFLAFILLGRKRGNTNKAIPSAFDQQPPMSAMPLQPNMNMSMNNNPTPEHWQAYSPPPPSIMPNPYPSPPPGPYSTGPVPNVPNESWNQYIPRPPSAVPPYQPGTPSDLSAYSHSPMRPNAPEL